MDAHLEPRASDASGTDDARPAATAATTVAVLLSRSIPALGTSSHRKSSGSAGAVRVAVAARLPRKREWTDDPVRYRVEHYTFLDDRRRFTNLDALLTRLAPVGSVVLGCTESSEVSRSSNSPPRSQSRRAEEIADLLSKCAAKIDSRTDILAAAPSTGAGDDAAPEDGTLCSVLKSLPKPLHHPPSAAQYADRLAASLLGGEGSDRHLSYRGDRALSDATDALPKRALGLLLQHLGKTSAAAGGLEDGAYEILPGTLNSYLTLDRTAAQSINLLPPLKNSGVAQCVVGGTSETNSLYGVLNRCLTRMGARLLEVWLRQPLVQLDEIVRRQDAVGCMVDIMGGRERLRDEGLGTVGGVDLDGLCSKLLAAAPKEELGVDEEGNEVPVMTPMEGSATKALETMYRVHTFAQQQLPALVSALSDLLGKGEGDSEYESPTGVQGGSAYLSEILSGLHRVDHELTHAGGASKLVESVLNMDLAPREFRCKKDFNPELDGLTEELLENEADLERCHDDMNEAWNHASGKSGENVKLESNPDGYQFRLLNKNDANLLRSRFDSDDVNVHRMLKNGVYFSSRELRGVADRKDELSKRYEVVQRETVGKAVSCAATYVPVLERASALIAELDVLASLAHVASYNPHGGYCRPTMTDSEEDGAGIVLEAARHPCVELQDDVEFIPNDISLKYGESNFLIVTGPNMGGKSTYIRSLGAIVTMAQIGSFVPCTSATINIVHHILARVGAGDLQDRGISTFMAEMLEASSILRTATKRSLIVVDELGRGTSTFDGYGLASAISEYIVERIGCPTVFATHFHELTSLEERHRSVRNCHVTAKTTGNGTGMGNLTFLYEVRPGPCLESFGIQVAEMANVPRRVIDDAKRKARQLENFDYRKKRRVAAEVTAADGADGAADSHEDAERKAARIAFLNEYRKMPPPDEAGMEERKEAVLELARKHGVRG